MASTQQHSSHEEDFSESEVVSEKYEEKLQFAEEIGRILEDDGQPRIAGRLLGWLMVCDPPYQSFDDLVDALDVSKGSISTMTRQMIDSGLVKRVTFPGDRKSYYQVRSEAWVQVLKQRLQMASRFADVTKAGIKMMGDEPEKSQRRIREMHNFMVFFIEQMEEAIEDYESKFDDVIPNTG